MTSLITSGKRRPSLKLRQVGSHITRFEACSAFTHVPACMLAKSPNGNPLHQRLRRLRHLHRRSDCFRLERPVAGWDSHPLGISAFPRRTELSGLAGLCDGKDLARLGQGDTWLTSCPSSEYGYTRRWARAIRQWAPQARGLVWPSRRDPSKRAYVFFEDRFSAGLEEDLEGLPSTAGGLPLDTGIGELYLLHILDKYWVTLAP